MRAGDADRERVAERLRLALDEGRLNLHEYDERLQQTYLARTYGELDALLADLPAAPGQLAPTPTTSTATSRWVPGPNGTYSVATRRWLIETWQPWVGAVSTCVAIWGVTCLVAGELIYFWPGWVAGPWGAVLLVRTMGSLLKGEPQRWAAKQARNEAEREVRRLAKGKDKPTD